MAHGNLLIVDDEALLVKMLKLNLAPHAEKILTASDGLEALDVMANEEIHCVICDINMPKMNGVEVIKAVRNNNNDVPFIFYTAHGNHSLMLEAAKYGAFDFLDKPNFEHLEEIIARGLAEGFKRSKKTSNPEDQMMTDYQKILDEISLSKEDE